MQLKQTPQEFDQIQKQLVEALKPAQLDWNKNSNNMLLVSWLADRFTTAGLTDASFSNLWKAVAALKENLIWIVPPKSQDPKPVLSAESKGLRNHAQPREEYKPDPSKDFVALERKAKLTEAAESILGDAVRLIQEYRGKTHSATARGRDALKAILDKGAAGGAVNPAEALHILEKIRERSRSLYDEPNY